MSPKSLLRSPEALRFKLRLKASKRNKERQIQYALDEVYGGSLDNYKQTVADFGCSVDQADRFINACYVAQPKQLAFHASARLCDLPDGPTRVALGGTRGQAKTHAVVAQVVIDDCQRTPGLKVLFLRKIGKSAAESFDDLVTKVLFAVEKDWKPSRGILTLPNGSRVIMGGFRDEGDIDAYLGLEYDLIVIEDSTTLTKTKRDLIRGSLRSSKPNWRPREYQSTNPGGVGHQWFKQEFFDPWRRGAESETRFIHTTMGDNVFINSEYAGYLNSLTGWLRRAWRDGDFDISAGQYFSTWDERVHVAEPPERLPAAWSMWLAMDYGFTHWNVVYLLALSGDGDLYVIDEHAERKWLVPRHAEAVQQMVQRHNIEPWQIRSFVAGPDVFARKGESELTVAQQYDAILTPLGLPNLTPANTDRIQGAAEILRRLGDTEAGIPPSLFVSPKCPRLIACLPQLQHDPHRPEDVLKVDADPETGEGGDDFYDGFRYGAMQAATGDTYGPSPLSGYRG